MNDVLVTLNRRLEPYRGEPVLEPESVANIATATEPKQLFKLFKIATGVGTDIFKQRISAL